MKKDFITINKTNGTGNSEVAITCDENTTFSDRQTVISVDVVSLKKTVNITQKAFNAKQRISFVPINNSVGKYSLVLDIKSSNSTPISPNTFIASGWVGNTPSNKQDFTISENKTVNFNNVNYVTIEQDVKDYNKKITIQFVFSNGIPHDVTYFEVLCYDAIILNCVQPSTADNPRKEERLDFYKKCINKIKQSINSNSNFTINTVLRIVDRGLFSEDIDTLKGYSIPNKLTIETPLPPAG